jgi:2-keto-3-deoxy-L-rhamnonate aldolase RhmA
MQDAITRVLASCRTAGRRAAIHAATAQYAARMARSGFDLVTVWVDTVAVAATLAAADGIWAQQGGAQQGESTSGSAARTPAS